MNIAFISYEYPPDTGAGGIATYVRQAANMLHRRGHHVEVFAASPERSGSREEDGVLVHRIHGVSHPDFPAAVALPFAERHAAVGFDVLEAAEWNADAREAIRLVPTMPLVIKLHTPSFMVQEINRGELRFLQKARIYLGAARRLTRPYWHYDPSGDLERLHTLDADEVVMPSLAIGERVAAAWGLDRGKLAHVPYPYVPNPELLKTPVAPRSRVVGFTGRLEVRKGVVDLARAIPRILRRHPNTRFRFVGRSVESPEPGVSMQQYLERMLGEHRDSVEFAGPVPLDSVPSALGEMDVCVFPSLWDNFPLVCLEAMSAGRAIVASSSGGMAELLNQGEVGRLVPPHSPRRIAREVIRLLDDPAECARLGQAARARVTTTYSSERIGKLQEASYLRAIERRRASGARSG